MSAAQSSPLFDLDARYLPVDERVGRAYERARAIARPYKLTADDVLHYSPKFWDMHWDPMLPLDIGAFTIIAAHFNLTVGTIAKCLHARPDLEPLMESLMNLDTVGLYLLSERGHGLDAFNLETTATKVGDGWVLNTPREEAAKFMPASNPSFGVAKIAVVAARMIIDGEDHGCRFFLVPVCTDTGAMCTGVTSVRLPRRTGTSALDFSLTLFDNIKLPFGALLDTTTAKPEDARAGWWEAASRLQIGSAAVSAPCLKGLQHAAYIGAKYSLRRHVISNNKLTPIISFPTQQYPVLYAVAAGTILEKWFRESTPLLGDRSIDNNIRHGLSVVLKATVMRQVIAGTAAVAERCGAQGTFEVNFMATFEADVRGVVIAEGDVMTLCIRLWGEIAAGKYDLPLPPASDSILAELAHSIIDEHRAGLKKIKGGHRSQEAEYYLLPQAERAIMSIGHAMAYASARRAGVPQELLNVYECSVIRANSAWFSEVCGIHYDQQRERENAALRAAVPHLDDYVEAFGVSGAVRAAIVDGNIWEKTLKQLTHHRPAADAQLISFANSVSAPSKSESQDDSLFRAKL